MKATAVRPHLLYYGHTYTYICMYYSWFLTQIGTSVHVYNSTFPNLHFTFEGSYSETPHAIYMDNHL